jgi:hypothetical protein
MNEAELDAIVEERLAARLEARVAAERARVREETILELRREAERAHHARINAKAPIEGVLAGLTQAQEDERQRQMDERRRLAGERMDAANARPVAGQVVRGLRPTRADGAAGAAGFSIKA